MTNRALPTERTLPLPAMGVVVAAVAGLLALVVLVVAAVVMYRTADVTMAVPVTFAIGDYLSFPRELVTTLVPILEDGTLPSPSL